MIERIGYFFVLHFFRLLSFTPWFLIYRLSDFLFFLLFYVVRYRRRLVYKNLRNSFPDKSEQWLRRVRKQFYRTLADTAVESIKLFQFKPMELLSRFHFEDEAQVSNLLSEGRSVFVAMGHSGNWETTVQTLALKFKVPVTAIYKKPSSKIADQLMQQLRTGAGIVDVVESQSAYRRLASMDTSPRLIFILNDQTPPGNVSDYWTTFLHQDTPFFTGLDKMARALGYAVVFLNPRRQARGHYRLIFRSITNDSAHSQPGEISAQYVRLLEEAIGQQPHNWLWSHRRWKHKRPTNT
ncbi:lysophospholipid acyltransferase family protein [Bacteroidales bacterium]